jgi:hypothetical protein
VADEQKPSEGPAAPEAEAERVDLFWEDFRASYAKMTPEERAKEKAELAVLDTTLLDWLEAEPTWEGTSPEEQTALAVAWEAALEASLRDK